MDPCIACTNQMSVNEPMKVIYWAIDLWSLLPACYAEP